MTSLPIINQGRAYYAGSEFESEVQDEIDQLQTDVAAINSDLAILSGEVATLQTDVATLQSNTDPVMVQYYSVAPNDSALPGNTYALINGQTATTGTLPETQFTISSPGILQYIGGPAAFFLINYSVSGFIDSGTFPITFTLQRNATLLPSSTQIQRFSLDVTDFQTVSGFALTPLVTNDTISLRGRLEDASANILTADNICLNIVKVGV